MDLSMQQKTLGEILKDCLKSEGIFKNREALTTKYIPEHLCHREEQSRRLASVLAPTLRGGRSDNLFVHGSSGTGKTLLCRLITRKLGELAAANGPVVKIIEINCKMGKVADTEYRLVAAIARELGREIPTTGLPTQEVYDIFFRQLERGGKQVILILDEIDALLEKAGDGLLYNLTRINERLTKAKISIIGISNNTQISSTLDPRTGSSLCEQEVFFPPYNATQLCDILVERAHEAFLPGSVGYGVIEKCSALAAQEHGDARRAMGLLRLAGEIADEEGNDKVELTHVDEARSRFDVNCVREAVKTQPKQGRAILMSLMSLRDSGAAKIQSGELYSHYQTTSKQTSLSTLTYRRFSSLVGEMDKMGIVTAKISNGGRQGRTKIIELNPLMELINKELLVQ